MPWKNARQTTTSSSVGSLVINDISRGWVCCTTSGSPRVKVSQRQLLDIVMRCLEIDIARRRDITRVLKFTRERYLASSEIATQRSITHPTSSVSQLQANQRRAVGQGELDYVKLADVLDNLQLCTVLSKEVARAFLNCNLALRGIGDSHQAPVSAME